MRSRGMWVIVILAVLTACGQGSNEVQQDVIQQEYRPVPSFSADSAYAFIQKQVDFGPRVPNTPEHRQTGEWLQEKLASYGWEVIPQKFTAQSYDGKELQLTNIIASFQPELKKRIILAAHWDTRRIADKDTERIDEPIDGANDGGSGVGVLLEIARAISGAEEQLNVGIDIILFDGEDDGRPQHAPGGGDDSKWWCLGSQHWSRTP